MGDPFQRAKNDLPMKEGKHVDKSSRPAPSQAGRKQSARQQMRSADAPKREG